MVATLHQKQEMLCCFNWFTVSLSNCSGLNTFQTGYGKPNDVTLVSMFEIGHVGTAYVSEVLTDMLYSVS